MHLHDERPLGRNEALRLLGRLQGRGHALHTSAFYRLTSRGAAGAVLESWKVGGRRVTTEEAIYRFVNRLTGASVAGVTPTDATPTARASGSQTDREAAIDRAADALGL